MSGFKPQDLRSLKLIKIRKWLEYQKFQNEQDISNMAKKEWKYFVQYLRQIESQNEQ